MVVAGYKAVEDATVEQYKSVEETAIRMSSMIDRRDCSNRDSHDDN